MESKSFRYDFGTGNVFNLGEINQRAGERISLWEAMIVPWKVELAQRLTI